MTYLAFDLDGTVFDCSDIIVDAFKTGIEEFIRRTKIKIAVPGKETIVAQLGQPNDLIFEHLFPDLSADSKREINDLCITSLAGMVRSGAGTVFDGVREVIERFYDEGYKILVASNGRIEYISAILSRDNLMSYITQPVIIISESVKDKNEIVRNYINNVSKDNLLIMIGDRESDKNAAAVNNIPFIACSFGHAPGVEIADNKWIAVKFRDIYSLVKEVEAQHE